MLTAAEDRASVRGREHTHCYSLHAICRTSLVEGVRIAVSCMVVSYASSAGGELCDFAFALKKLSTSQNHLSHIVRHQNRCFAWLTVFPLAQRKRGHWHSRYPAASEIYRDALGRCVAEVGPGMSHPRLKSHHPSVPEREPLSALILLYWRRGLAVSC